MHNDRNGNTDHPPNIHTQVTLEKNTVLFFAGNIPVMLTDATTFEVEARYADALQLARDVNAACSQR